ncbi:hypothetical protein CC78DRAFT_586383 [Lojkania enalia]|uniref:Uncharacterized protein n=1 Tax=Lojkania enalia TaxID=147567 RepID=A0A9P4JXP7_9PLEO|nr:hypothetical protein CC78DRAFT_586383 [Didymosphaeria enalia]
MAVLSIASKRHRGIADRPTLRNEQPLIVRRPPSIASTVPNLRRSTPHSSNRPIQPSGSVHVSAHRRVLSDSLFFGVKVRVSALLAADTVSCFLILELGIRHPLGPYSGFRVTIELLHIRAP